MYRRVSIITGVAAATVLCGVATWWWTYQPSAVAVVAEEILQTCMRGEENHEVCYEREIPARFGRFTIPQLFDVIRYVRQRDPEYQFCHVTAHKLGELAVAVDPSKWPEVVPLNPVDGLCSNGFIHGAVIGRFRDEVFDDAKLRAVLPDFATACLPRGDWEPSDLDQAMCFHGLGHLYMFITNADYSRALGACNETANPPGNQDFSRVCREGVFMQTYQVIEPDDEELITHLPEKPTRENYRRICAQFSSAEDEGACLREGWILFDKETLTVEGMKAFCSGQPNINEERHCYESMFALLGRRSQNASTHARIGDRCNEFTGDIQTLCLGFAARAFIEEDRYAVEHAVAVCAKGSTTTTQEACLESLVSTTRFMFGTNRDAAYNFCDALSGNRVAACKRAYDATF